MGRARAVERSSWLGCGENRNEEQQKPKHGHEAFARSTVEHRIEREEEDDDTHRFWWPIRTEKERDPVRTHRRCPTRRSRRCSTREKRPRKSTRRTARGKRRVCDERRRG